MDERYVDELVASGDLTPDWRPSFLAVPRQRFIRTSSGTRWMM
jgi:hypothetical protein